MHSAKTDPPTSARRLSTGSARGLTQRLNVRLVLALASVALVALLVSAATLNQILPGLFVRQDETRARLAAGARLNKRGFLALTNRDCKGLRAFVDIFQREDAERVLRTKRLNVRTTG